MDEPNRVREGRGTGDSNIHRRDSQRTRAYGQTSPDGPVKSRNSLEGDPPSSTYQARRSLDRTTSASNEVRYTTPMLATGQRVPAATLLIRRLSPNIDDQGLNNLLAFAEGLFDARLVAWMLPEDRGFVAATAAFQTIEGAHDARRRLHGKPNCTSSGYLIVEYLPATNEDAYSPPRWDAGLQLSRQISNGNSSGTSPNAKLTRHMSYSNGTYSSASVYDTHEQALPALPGKYYREARQSNNGAQRNGLASPQASPEATFRDQPNVSTRSAVNDPIDDDETRDLLNDPVAYARNGGQNVQDRRYAARPSVLTDFSNLSLGSEPSFHGNGHQTGDRIVSPSTGPYNSRATIQPIYSPTTENSQYAWQPNGLQQVTSNGSYRNVPEHAPRPQYPPANPADQHPPCNTLYIGNLPHNVAEDELKAIFSKQRGYRRIMLRHRHNGPVCFCEFEDIPTATKALHELYGYPLHNSTKGGVRLSFSKNPLGVRAGQGSSMDLQSPLGSPGAYSAGAVGFPPGFSSINGPPPGLPTPGTSLPHTMTSIGGVPGYFASTSPPRTRSYSGHAGFWNSNMSTGYPLPSSPPEATFIQAPHRGSVQLNTGHGANQSQTGTTEHIQTLQGYTNYQPMRGGNDGRENNSFRRSP